MRKIPPEHECPIDNLMLYMADPLLKCFKAMNFTPNGITTLSLVFGVASTFSLYKGHVWISVACMALSYFFDVLDGHYARTYNMTSKFGDWYDHIKDIVIFITFISILYYRNKSKFSAKGWLVIVAVSMLFGLGTAIQFACQERSYDINKDGDSLAWLGKFVKSKDSADKCLRVARVFGSGDLMLCLLVFTVYIEQK